MINAKVPFFFPDAEWNRHGGIIISPDSLIPSLRCSWPIDAGTMGLVCPPGTLAPSYAAAADEAADISCVPGCKPLGQGWCSGDTGLCNVQCSMGGHCPWAPSSLKGMLTQHEAIVDPDGARPYNELIIDPKAWRNTLPAGLEGVFFYGAADSESAAYARSVRDTFASEFGLSAAQQPPLMQMDMWARPSSPFALVL